MSSDQEQLRALIEKHKAADQPKTFFFMDKYYKLQRDEFNVMNWCVLPTSVEQYNSEMTGIPLNITTVPPDNTVSS